MPSFINLAGILLAVYFLLKGVKLLIGTIRIIKMPLWAPLHTSVSREELGEFMPIFEAARTNVEAAGLALTDTLRERGILAIKGLPSSYIDVYHDAARNIYAETAIADVPAPGRPYVVSLKSYLNDGSVLVTTNNPLTPWHPSTVRLQECDTSDIAGMASAHMDQRASLGIACIVQPQSAAQLATKFATTMLPAMRSEGMVSQRGMQDGEPVFGFRMLPALKAALGSQQRYDKLRKKVALAAKTAPATEPALLAALFAAQRVGLERTIVTLRGLSAPRWLQSASLAVSVPAFVAVGAWFWGMQTAIAIGVVIALHEGGHWLAMKIAGFREVQVFFVPGFGGATVGEKHEARPLTHLFVYLAGPVPGLALVAALFAYTVANPAFMQTPVFPAVSAGAAAALFVNLFNLLPVLPLDGGRVVDLFLFARFPWMRLAFALVSGVLILACGWHYKLTSMQILGGLMLFALQAQYRQAKASALFRRQFSAQQALEQNQTVAVREVCHFVCQPRFHAWNFATKLSIASALLPRRLGGTPGWKASIAGLAIYVTATALPLAAIAIAAFGYPQQAGSALWSYGLGRVAPQAAKTSVSEDDLRKKRAEKLASAPPAKHFEALKDAIREASDYDDDEDSLRLAKIYFDETAALPAPAREHADAILTLVMESNRSPDEVSTTFDMKRGSQLLQEAEQIERTRYNKDHTKDDALELAAILTAQSTIAGTSPAIARQQEILTLYESNLPAYDPSVEHARSRVAHELDLAGKADDAEALLRKNLAAIESAPQDDRMHAVTLSQAGSQLAWLLVKHQKFDEARQMANVRIAASMDEREIAGARRMLWLIARKQETWAEAKIQADALISARASTRTASGNWLSKWLAGQAKTPVDPDASLMLIEATRALGDGAAADALAKQMRDADVDIVKTSHFSSLCRHISHSDASPIPEYLRALAEIEQREFHCPVPSKAVEN